MKTLGLTLVALGTAAGLAAQSDSGDSLPIVHSAADWMVPLHAAPAASGDQGLWAGGPSFKARFGSDFTFYPVLGNSAPHNLPVTWRTDSLRYGSGADLASAAPKGRAASAWRYEIEHESGVVEAYDVLESGVEQTFVLPYPGADAVGQDFIVSGLLTTDLRAPNLRAAHSALRFADENGMERVEYGAATVIDAAGRRMPLTTSFDGERISITVSGEWLAQASWPVVVDPLLSTVNFGLGSNPVVYTSSTRDFIRNRYVVAYCREVSASDLDVYVRVRDHLLGHVATIHNDLTATNTWDTSVGFASGSGRYVIASTADSGFGTRVRLYSHDADSASINSGTSFEVPAFTLHDAAPSLGGGDANEVFLAFRRDAAPSNTSNSIVVGVKVNATTLGFTSTFSEFVSNPALTNYDAENPSVSNDDRGDGWVVAWQEFNHNNASDDWDVVARRANSNGAVSSGLAVFGEAGSTLHKFQPRVAGVAGRYAMVWLERANGGHSLGTNFGRAVWMQRFFWDEASANVTLGDLRRIRLGVGNRYDFGRGNAFDVDYLTRSHWTVAYRDNTNSRIYVERRGYDLGEVEGHIIASNPPAGASWGQPAVSYAPDGYEFTIFYGEDGPGGSVYGRRMEYEGTSTTNLGGGCSGVTNPSNYGPRELPYRGSALFWFTLDNGEPNASTWLLAGFGQGPSVPLPYGRPGCSLGLFFGAPIIQLGTGTTNASGYLATQFPVISSADPIQLVLQHVQLDANGQLTSSDRLQCDIQ